MRLQPIAAGVVALSCIGFAACSSSAGFTPPNPTPLPSTTPIPPALAYTGTMTQHFTYEYGYPSQQPPVTVVTRITDRVSERATTPPAAIPPEATTEVTIAETDATSLQTTNLTTHAYLALAGKTIRAYGSIAAIDEPSGGESSTTTTVYAKPQIVSKGDGRWSNSPAATIDETYGDGHYEDRTIEADGTYAEKGTTLALSAHPAPILLEERTSGAGFYQGPFEGCPSSTAFRFTPPSGSPPHIVLRLTSPASYCSGSPQRIDGWYPASPRFYKETDSASAGVRAPSQCGRFAGKNETDVRSTVARLDTIVGYAEIATTDAYAASSGTDCIVLRDVLSNYYDWQGDTTSFFTYTPDGKPISEVVTNETLVRSPASESSSLAAPAIAAAARERVAARMEATRERMLRAMMRRLETTGRSFGGTR